MCRTHSAGNVLFAIAAALVLSAFRPQPLPAPAAGNALALTAPVSQVIPIAGKPTAVEAYQAGNKFYVAESLGGNLLAFDGATHQLRTTIPISGIVLGRNLAVNETYGRAYAASRTWEGSEFGSGSGMVYVVDVVNDRLLRTIDLSAYLGSTRYVLAHDETHDRIYVSCYGLCYIDVSTNTVHPISLPVESFFFSPNEIAVNEQTNELYMVQMEMGYQRLWILDAQHWTWSWVDFEPLGAFYPQHVAVSAAENRVYAKLIGVPGQPEPGLFWLDRDDGSHGFIGNEDYGEMAVNDLSGRLYTGVEVGFSAAIVQVATNQLWHVPMAGTTTVVGVRHSTDHAFLAGTGSVAIVDGATRTVTQVPVANEPMGGILVQDVAVNQATGWVYAIPDDDLPLVVAVLDPGESTPPTVTPTPSVTATPAHSATPGSTATPTGSATPSSLARSLHLPLALRGLAPSPVPTPSRTPTASRTPAPSVTPTASPTSGGLSWSGTTSQGYAVRLTTDAARTVVTQFVIEYGFTCTGGSGGGEDTINGSFPITGNTFTIDNGVCRVTGAFTSASAANGDWNKSWFVPPASQCQSHATWSASR